MASAFPEENVGHIIFQVKDDLERLKLKLASANDSVNVPELNETIQRTELSLKKHAEALLNEMHSRVNTLPEDGDLSGGNGMRGDVNKAIWGLHPWGDQGAIHVRRTGRTGFLESRENALLPVKHHPSTGEVVQMSALKLSPGDRLKREQEVKALMNPLNPRHRQEAYERYGVTLPQLPPKGVPKGPNNEKVVKGSVVTKLATLKKREREGYQDISEHDTRKGILSLMERGLIPPATQVELDPPPVVNKPIPMHDYSERTSRVPADQTEPGFNMYGYHLDERNDMDQNPTVWSIANYPGLPNALVDLIARRGAEPGGDSGGVRIPSSRREGPKSGYLKNRRSSDPTRPRSNSANMRLDIVPKDESTNKAEETRISPMKGPDASESGPPPPTTPASSKLRSRGNRFAIQNGKTRTETNEFFNFKQQYYLSWGCIVSMIRCMEQFLRKYSVPLAFINGNRLADLAVEYELDLKPSEMELLACIVNREDVERIVRKPGRQFSGADGANRAAVRIQATYRGYAARKAYLEYRKKKWAAGVIAIRWLLFVKMATVKRKLKMSRERHQQNAKLRLNRLIENWDTVKSSRRVIIHLPSLNYPLDVRKNIPNFAALQNTQMARLCDLKDDNVEVIYISPVPISDDLIQYYSRLMGLKSAIGSGNVNDQKPLTDRYKIIVPEAVKAFVERPMCLSTLLKYSPRALKRIRNLIQGRQAVLIPGLMHVDDLAVADYLDCPILGPADPQLSQLYSAKSGARRVFVASGWNTIPPGECDIYNEEQLHEVLSQLVTENLSVSRWLLKLDHEVQGRGIAYVDIADHWDGYKWALKERERYGEKWKKKWAQENVYNRLLAQIAVLLEKHAVPVDKSAYPNWPTFLSAFLSHGGVVEAFPASESVTNLTVAMLLEPNGNIAFLTSGDQIHAKNPLSCWGLSVPQSSVEADVLNEACEKIGNACFERKIYGHVTVDFVTFIDSQTNDQVLWPTDLEVRPSDYLAMQQLAMFATNGRFLAADHVLSVPLKPPPEERLINAAARRRQNPATENQKTQMAQRYVTMSCSLYHSNFSSILYSVFFQICRAHGIGYDVKEKSGTIFTLMDSFERHQIGMITIGETFEKALQQLARNLYTLHEEVSSPKMQGNTNFKAVIEEVEAILGQAVENMDLKKS